MKYNRVVEYIKNNEWAILPEKLEAILNFISYRANGESLTPEELASIVQAQGRPSPRAGGSVAVLQLHGVISHRSQMMKNVSEPPGTSTESFGARFDEMLARPDVKAIVLDVNSPGGTVQGVQELSDKIYQGRKQKHIVAVANSLAASAAYWIATAADEVVVTPSGQVGSIGVFTVHQDFSKAYEEAGIKTTLISAGKHKVDGNPFEPLSEEARERIQENINYFYGMFVQAVGRNRGVPVSTARNSFGQGRVVNADEALESGMVDRVATLESVLRSLGAGPTASNDSNENAQKRASNELKIKGLSLNLLR